MDRNFDPATMIRAETDGKCLIQTIGPKGKLAGRNQAYETLVGRSGG